LTKGNQNVTNKEAVVKQVELFKTDAGREPFADWLEDLDKVTRAKINSFLDRVALGGEKKISSG